MHLVKIPFLYDSERERERLLFKFAMLFMILVAMWDNMQHTELYDLKSQLLSGTSPK